MANSGLRFRFNSNRGTPQSPDNNVMADSPSRRTTRFRKQPKKFGDFMQITPTKRNTNKYASTSSSSDEDMIDDEVSKIKPTALFSTDDVEGQNMFQFKSRHTVIDLQKVVQSANCSPKGTPKTPRKSVLSQAMQNSKETESTPRHVKNIIKKRISREVNSESEESDFSADSCSDFVPEESENETDSGQTSENDDSDNEEKSHNTHQKAQLKGKGSKAKPKDLEYFVTPDNYFMMHSSKKIQTSDHTLARLKNLNLDENENKDIPISKEHKNKILELNATYAHLFNRWLYVLSENFNIILYGIGSKRSILHQFQTEKLTDFPCVVVNGFFPSLTIKSVLESIVIDLLGLTHVPSNIGDTVNLIDDKLTENEAELFLIIHNIDGATLRSAKAQATLASLSQIRNVHMIASVDHINAPLLWDHSKLSKFRWSWWDATSLRPYAEEAAGAGGAGGARGAALQLAALRSVQRSLTHNARGVFRLLARHRLQHERAHYRGLPFKELYGACREQFLVSSELALRAQLTEFVDHRLVRARRAADGTETLLVAPDAQLLRLFLDQEP